MTIMYRILIFIGLFIFSGRIIAQDVYEVSAGSVNFHSNAPKELIHSVSDKLKGVVDIKKKIFAFKVNIGTFMGFNSPLQREHFNENYMETTAYPEATFTGKIIEDIDFTKDGDYTVRAKGKMNIHGIPQERIINSKVKVKDGKIYIHSDFVVPLSDHDIKIPKVVYEKLAANIDVTIEATLVPKK
jgi:hypothetical protein